MGESELHINTMSGFNSEELKRGLLEERVKGCMLAYQPKAIVPEKHLRSAG
jgi:hypothetical protein